MPGTPPTSPRLGLPRFAMTDVDQVPTDLNAVVDAIDPKVGLFASGLLMARPSTGAGIADRYYYATDEGVLYRDAGGATPSWTAVNPRSRAIVTALPGSPYDGQEILYRSTSAVVGTSTMGDLGILWPLRYNAGSASPYKWEPVGEPQAILANVDAYESTSSATYVDLATVGPQVTVPLAGEYLVNGVADVSNISNLVSYHALKIGAAATADAEAFARFYGNGGGSANDGGTGGRTIRRTASAAATALKMQYKAASGAVTFGLRTLEVRPARVG